MTWPAQARLGAIVQFHTCLLCWHLSEHIFPPSAFPLTLFCISSSPICRRVIPRISPFCCVCGGGGWGRRRAPTVHVLRRATGFSFGDRSELKEKESSPPRKHLDNCLLQHEKQLEVSGSWERGGEGGGGRGGGGSAVCIECEKGQREREVRGGKRRRSEEEGAFDF